MCWTHLVEVDAETGACDLPGGFGSGESGADDGYGMIHSFQDIGSDGRYNFKSELRLGKTAVIKIAAMEASHWPQVQAIYLEGIATSNATFEQTAPEWEMWNTNHHAHSRLVAMDETGVAGWAALSPVSARYVYRGVAEVSVYVAELARGSGVGRRLMTELIEVSEVAGVWTLQAAVFPENEASIRLHRSAGFRVIGERERVGCLAGRWRSTILMERRSSIAGVIPD
jgi:L-amino acid N-acyltransferase YncA